MSFPPATWRTRLVPIRHVPIISVPIIIVPTRRAPIWRVPTTRPRMDSASMPPVPFAAVGTTDPVRLRDRVVGGECGQALCGARDRGVGTVYVCRADYDGASNESAIDFITIEFLRRFKMWHHPKRHLGVRQVCVSDLRSSANAKAGDCVLAISRCNGRYADCGAIKCDKM